MTHYRIESGGLMQVEFENCRSGLQNGRLSSNLRGEIAPDTPAKRSRTSAVAPSGAGDAAKTWTPQPFRA
ncbi:MAG: hypothetical protein WBX15_13000 [Thermoanaerobaculia bacterium]